MPLEGEPPHSESGQEPCCSPQPCRPGRMQTPCSLLVRPGGGGGRVREPTPCQTPLPSPEEVLPIRPLGHWDWATWRGASTRPAALGSIDSIPLTTLAGSPARGGKCALRETPRPDKRAFVRAGGENVWVLGFLGSGACSLPISERWANIAGIKRRAACPACPAGPAGAGGCRTPRLLCLPSSAWSSWERRDLDPDGRGWVCFEEDPWEPVLPPGGPREAVSVSLTFLMLKVEVSPVSPPAPRGGSDS